MKANLATKKMLEIGKVSFEANARVLHHGIYTMRALISDGQVICCFLISDKDASVNVPDYSGMHFKSFSKALAMLKQRYTEYMAGELVTKPS